VLGGPTRLVKRRWVLLPGRWLWEDRLVRDDGGMAKESNYHFLVSYEREDEAWARWIAWQIEDALLVDGEAARVFFDVWDVVPGESTAGAIDRALRHSARVVLVLSPRSLSSEQPASRVWQAAWLDRADDDRPPVVPVRVVAFSPGGLLAGRRYIDLAGLDEAAATAALGSGLGHAVRGGRAKSPDQPPFPGLAASPSFPGSEAFADVVPRGVGTGTAPEATTLMDPPDGDPLEGASNWAAAAPPTLAGRADDPPGGGPAKRRRPATLRLVAVAAAVIAVIATSSTVAALRMDGGTASSPVVPNVALQPIRTGGDNPFMPPVGDDVQGVTPPAGVHGGLAADIPGLFGGTRDDARCDPSKLVTFLKAHADLLAAWSAVLGIQSADLDGYVTGLTPVVLRADTAVTNHGFRDGRPTAFPAVLQAGTAVLADRHGAPVVKCFCGNPLTPPARYSQVRYTGPPGPGFSAQTVTSVQSTTTTINVFILVDVRTGKPFQRPAGTGGTQDRSYTRTTDIDWRNTSYTTDCDGSAGSMTVTVRNGTGAASRAGRTYNLNVVTVTGGELAGDRDPETAVLLSCHPEPSPSNFFVTEIQVFRTGPERMAVLSPPDTAAPLGPAYFDDALTIQNGRLYTRVHDYDSSQGNFHPAGPSAYQDISWQWNGQRFVSRVDATSTPPPATPSPRQTTLSPVGPENAPQSLAATWKGSYVCAQGVTGLRLTITSAGGESLAATFEFYPLPQNPTVPRGVFIMRGTYSGGQMLLQGDHWVTQPAGYSMVDLTATVTAANPHHIGGSVLGQLGAASCGDFSIDKI
jgi:TIR domain